MVLAVGAVHSNLVKLGLRGYHHKCSNSRSNGYPLFCCSTWSRSTTINPYLAIDSIYQRYKKKLFEKLDFQICVDRFKKSINNGLLKIMAKMGISVLSSYRGGCNF